MRGKQIRKRSGRYASLGSLTVVFLPSLLAVMVMLMGSTALGTNISDYPMETEIQPAPPSVMFVLDDSGSMNWGMMVSSSLEPGMATGQGKFNYKKYIFSGLDDANKERWECQWQGTNKLYYNPQMDYVEWPSGTTFNYTIDSSNARYPRNDPSKLPTFDLLAIFHTLTDSSSINLVRDNLQPAPAFECSSDDWLESSHNQTEYKGSSYYTTKHNASATWRFDVPIAGSYGVWLWWACNPGDARDQAATYTVHHAGGDTDLPVMNQKENAGRWNFGGNFSFNAGTAGYVKLTRTSSSGGTSADAVKLMPAGEDNNIYIRNAHYYLREESTGQVYLVNFTSENTREYYRFNPSASGDYRVSYAEMTPVADLPASLKTATKVVDGKIETWTYPDAATDFINFARWYSFYRTRKFAAKAAVGRVIDDIEGVRVGFYSIHQRLNQVPLDVMVTRESVLYDNTGDLLDALYAMTSSGGTPLRRALQEVGKFYDGEANNISTVNPYETVAMGGGCQQMFAIAMTDGYWNGSAPVVGNADGDQGAPFQDTYENTLADVAMYYYKKDLSDLPDDVPTSSCDMAGWQHMVTYTVSFGVEGTIPLADLNKDGLTDIPEYADDPCFLVNNSYPTWTGVSGNARKIDDLLHAAINGRGVYYSASDPQALVDALTSALEDIENRVASGASAALSGEEVQSGSDLYQALYSSATWTGDLTKRTLSVDPSTGKLAYTDPVWHAADELDAMALSDRRIVTFDGSDGIPFRHDRLTATQQASLGTDSIQVVDYIRGAEISGFRERESRLGDIIHSAPLLLGNTVFVGANDGMLHAFDASNGKELFGYIPSIVLGRLDNLTDIDYSHELFVDMTPNYMMIPSVGTLLVGGLGKGGKGYYALNATGLATITDTTTETDIANAVMWEFTHGNLGYTFSEPLLVKAGDPASPTWVVVFGNGYNSDPSGDGDTTGHLADAKAALIIIDAATGGDTANGGFVKVIETSVGDDNGLATPALIDKDENGVVDYAYAGDLKGNLWKFDLSNKVPALWAVANSGQPLYHVASGDAITIKPDVMRHCEDESTVMVVFGTGRFLHGDDRDDVTTKSIYGIWDYGEVNSGNLQQQTVISYTENPDIGGQYIRMTSSNDVEWYDAAGTVNQTGWYLDLPLSGERVVKDVKIVAGLAEIISFIPDESPCNGGGNSIVHKLNACTGARSAKAQYDIDGDGDVDADDLVELDITGEFGAEIDIDEFTTYFDASAFSVLSNGGSEITDATLQALLNTYGDGTSLTADQYASAGITIPFSFFAGGGSSIEIDDLRKIFTTALLAPTGLSFTGMLHTSVSVDTTDETATEIFSSSGANSLETVTTIKDIKGMYYWLEKE
ncbi:MAG: hypothetical protein CSA22_07000 [Deltaproteobacteria bacterium]|nr:MAG: hypothetical protein CSA22_07000 [Deltaproteobacteria bacterium]